MLKEKYNNLIVNNVLNIMKDTLRYLDNIDSEELERNTDFIWVRNLFWGFVVKDRKELTLAAHNIMN